MRRINELFSNKNITVDNISQYPFLKLVKDPNGILCFRYYLTPNGDDANDGQTWETAKKTFKGIADDLPEFLDHPIYIYCHGGNYGEQPRFTWHVSNVVFINWIPSVCNTASNTWIDWIMQGKTYTIPNDNPAIFTAGTSQICALDALGVTDKAQINIICQKPGEYLFYFNKLQFEGASSVTGETVLFLNNLNFYCDSGLNIKCNTAKYGIRMIYRVNGFMNSFSIDGGTGDVKTSNSVWRGAIYFEGYQKGNMQFKRIQLPHATGHEPPNNHPIQLNNVYNFITLDPNSQNSPIVLFENYDLVDAAHDLGYKPRIFFACANSGGNVSYDDTIFDFVNYSNVGYNAKHYSAGVLLSEETAVNKDIKNIAGNIVLSAANTATSSASLVNGNISFSLDETGNNLLVTVKYSDGTVKTGTVSLL